MSQLTDEQIREAWERTEIWSAEGASQSLPSFARGFCYTLRIKPAQIERWAVVDDVGKLIYICESEDAARFNLEEAFGGQGRIVHLVEQEK